MSGRIFISYRRRDTAPQAGRIYDYLSSQFGRDQVFIDVDNIELGQDILEVIENAVASCQVFLALIGPQWLSAADEDGGRRRLDDPYDFIRLEIEAALRHNVRLIPILIDDARMPHRDDLPDALEGLARRNALSLDRQHFRQDISQLIEVVQSVLEASDSSKPSVLDPRVPSPQRSFLTSSNRIFVSYSHKDGYWIQRLQVHLRPLERGGKIEVWSDLQIQAGDEWREEIKKAIESCQAAILVISADFMASDFIYYDELAPLLEAAKSRGVRIIPLLVSSSNYKHSSLAKFQAVNRDLVTPLDMLPKGEQEAYLFRVYEEVKEALEGQR